MSIALHKALFEQGLSCAPALEKIITKAEADRLFVFFRDCSLFRWRDMNNNCEDRANAISILLDEWKIPNYKGWVFSGAFLKNERGALLNNWKYHVAAALQVQELNSTAYYIIDPATLDKLETIQHWANNVTGVEHTYYFITEGNTYIFHPAEIKKDNWFTRNRQNYKWTIQGLAGINGVSTAGKAQLIFCKRKIHETDRRFKALLKNKDFLR